MRVEQPPDSDAFCLIVYRSADGTLTEKLWNARTGPAPAAIYARDGATLLQRSSAPVARYLGPQYRPRVGERIIAAFTFDQLLAEKLRLVNDSWDNPEFQRIVVAGLASRLGPQPSPSAIARHLAACEHKRYGPRDGAIVMV